MSARYVVLVAEPPDGEGRCAGPAAHQAAGASWSWVTYDPGLGLEDALRIARGLLAYRPRCEIRVVAVEWATVTQTTKQAARLVYVEPVPVNFTYIVIPDRVLGSMDSGRREFPEEAPAHAYATTMICTTADPWRVYRVCPAGSWSPVGSQPRRVA